MNHQPYSPDSTCSKCGFAHITTETQSTYWGAPTPRIRRQCANCSYEWMELPLDHDPEREREVLAEWNRLNKEMFARPLRELYDPHDKIGTESERSGLFSRRRK